MAYMLIGEHQRDLTFESLHCSLILHAGPIVILMWMIILHKYGRVHHPSLPRFPDALLGAFPGFLGSLPPHYIYILGEINRYLKIY